MILKFIPISSVDTALHHLPEPDMVVDPRPNGMELRRIKFKFNFSVNGTTVTMTRIRTEEDMDSSPGWKYGMRFRVYSRNEFHYSFECTKYLYHGLKDERAPHDATEVIVKDGVEMIDYGAFLCCRSLSKITIPDTVINLMNRALYECSSLRCIELPSNLESIGYSAFYNCSKLEAIFIPPTVTLIGEYAFQACQSLKIINFPDNSQYIESNIFSGCSALVTDDIKNVSNEAQMQWFRNRYNPLHNLCLDPSVTAQDIQQYIQAHHDDEARARTYDKPQFTALHLLAANPSVTGEMINSYLQFAPDVAVLQDSIGKTPLHMVCSKPSLSDASLGAIRAFLGWSGGKQAAFMKDDEGRTPFDYLCEKSFDELSPLENNSFADLFAWWYECLGIDLFAQRTFESDS